LRQITKPTCRFTDHFRGFHEIDAIKTIFGNKTQDTLTNLKVEFTNATLYMRVTHEGTLLINPHYLSCGDFAELYLDLIHELVHVKQALNGKNSDPDTCYVERPLEIEAYQTCVNEARNLGWDDNKILAYLDSDLINEDELKQLARTLEVNFEEDIEFSAMNEP